MQILVLFLIFCYFGLLCLSGGSSLLQFYLDELVTARQWLTLEELGNLMAISQVTPGPIGVNLATFLGYTQGGFFGGLAATIGLLTPSFFLMSLAVKSYTKWKESNLVRSLMYAIKPMTLALVVTSLMAGLGMSIFTDPIPLDRWFGFADGPAGDFGLRWEMLPILVSSAWTLGKKKLSIMQVVFLSAALGAGVACLFG